MAAPTGSGADSRELRTYEAAVIDQLAQLGYRTDAPADSASQITELHIGHDVVVPQEQKRSPVSGEMAVAYFTAHAPRGFYPINNMGDFAILFCFVFLYFFFAGPGPWSLDALIARRRTAG